MSYDSSKSRWLAIAAVLLLLFLLAAVGGYLLQRRGSQPAPEDLATAGSPPARPQDGDPNANSQPPTQPGGDAVTGFEESAEEPTVEEQSGAGFETPANPPFGESGGDQAGAGEGSSGRISGEGQAGSGKPSTPPGNETTGSEFQKAPFNAPPEKKPGVSGAGNAVSSLEGSATAPPIPLEPQPPNPPPGSVVSETKKPVETTIVADAGTFGAASPGASPAPKQPPPPAPVEEGIIYWTGRLKKDQVIVIELGRASTGQAEGTLPGTPVDVWLPSQAVVVAERPNPKNNWSRVAFRCLQNSRSSVTVNVQWKLLR